MTNQSDAQEWLLRSELARVTAERDEYARMYVEEVECCGRSAKRAEAKLSEARSLFLEEACQFIADMSIPLKDAEARGNVKSSLISALFTHFSKEKP